MASVWELITDSSGLPIQAGNTLWDHLNDLGSGVGGGDITVVEVSGIAIELSEESVEVMLESIEYEVEIDSDEIEVALDEHTIDVELNTDELDIEL